MIRRGIALPSRRFYAWTAISTLVPMTIALLAWALKADVERHPFGIAASLLVGACSFILIMGAIELLKRLEAAGWRFEAPLLRNWGVYYGLWLVVGLGVGVARSSVLQAAFGLTFHPGRALFEVAICLYAVLGVACSLEHQTMFMREASRKQEASRRAVRDLFESREAFAKASDLRRYEVLSLLERRVEPELRSVLDGVERLGTEGTQLTGEAGNHLLSRLDHLRDAEIRKVSHLLHPSIIDVGLAPALRALVRSRRDSLGIDLEADATLLEGLPSALRLQVYRIVEQAIDLASQHGAHHLRVALTRDGAHGLTLLLEAHGEGIDRASAREAVGLALIDARVALMDGAWEKREASEARVALRLAFPWREAEPQPAMPRR